VVRYPHARTISVKDAPFTSEKFAEALREFCEGFSPTCDKLFRPGNGILNPRGANEVRQVVSMLAAANPPRIENAPTGCDKRVPGYPRAQPQPQRAVAAVVGEREPGVAAPKWIEAVPAGARDELRDAVAGPEPLHIVLVAIDDDRCAAAKRPPERLDVGLITVH
jgi:hypothetical protein